MANKHKGEFTLKAGKQRYTLKLTTNAVCEFEDFDGAKNKAGVERTWDQVVQGLEKGQLRDIRLFFWVALRAYHEDIATDDATSLKAVGDIIDRAGGLNGVSEQLTAFVRQNASASQEDDGEPEEVPTAARPSDAQVGTGTGSLPTH